MLLCFYNLLQLRINFTLEEMAPAIPAYKYFRECLTKQYYTDYGDSIHFEAEPLDLSKIPQCFDYNRVKEMVSMHIIIIGLDMICYPSYFYRNYGKFKLSKVMLNEFLLSLYTCVVNVL